MKTPVLFTNAEIVMSTWKINLKEQTATSINGITFKLTETKPGEYEGVRLKDAGITTKKRLS